MSLYEQMLSTSKLAGIKVLSDNTCCRLLAVVFKYGDESAVYSETMRLDIHEAQTRAGLQAGKVPDWLLIERIKFYADQIECGRADWLADIGERYGVTFPKLSPAIPCRGRDDWKERVHGGVRISEGQHRQAGQR